MISSGGIVASPITALPLVTDDIGSDGITGGPYKYNFGFMSAMTSLPSWATSLNFTYTRNSLKHVRQNGVLVQLANNQFGTSQDPSNGLYGYVPEPAATNLLQNSGWANSGGAAPTTWGQGTGTGTSTPATSTFNPYATAYDQSATSQRPYIQFPYTVATSTTYVLSVQIESITGTISANQVIGVGGLPSGATATYPVCEANPAGTSSGAVGVGKIVCILTTTTTGGSVNFRCGIGVSANSTGTIRMSSPQFETGSRATSWILTPTGATAARASDVLTCPLSNIVGFNSAAYTLFVDTRLDAGTASDNVAISINDGSTDNIAYIYGSLAATQINTVIKSAGISSVSQTIENISVGNRKKAAISATTNLCLTSSGGISRASDTSVTMPISPTTLSIGQRTSSSDTFNGYIYRVALIPRALTQAQLNAITT